MPLGMDEGRSEIQGRAGAGKLVPLVPGPKALKAGAQLLLFLDRSPGYWLKFLPTKFLLSKFFDLKFFYFK